MSKNPKFIQYIAAGTLCYLGLDEYANLNVKKEIKWQLFNIETLEKLTRDCRLDMRQDWRCSEEGQRYYMKEIEDRNKLIIELYNWMKFEPLWTRLWSNPPSNELCDYI